MMNLNEAMENPEYLAMARELNRKERLDWMHRILGIDVSKGESYTVRFKWKITPEIRDGKVTLLVDEMEIA